MCIVFMMHVIFIVSFYRFGFWLMFLIFYLIILSRYGIEVAGISSDGDTRLLRCMKLETKIGKKHLNNMPLYFNCSLSKKLYVQDTIHIGTKLRNRLLKQSVILPMGNYQVSVSHLKNFN